MERGFRDWGFEILPRKTELWGWGAKSSSVGSLKLGHRVFGEARKLEKEILGVGN